VNQGLSGLEPAATDFARGRTGFATLVHRSFEGPQAEDARRELQPWLSAIRKSYEYDRVFVIDNQGIQRIAVPDAPEPSGGRQASAIAQIMRSGQSNFLDLHQGGSLRKD
jgi:hypothetical protein